MAMRININKHPWERGHPKNLIHYKKPEEKSPTKSLFKILSIGSMGMVVVLFALYRSSNLEPEMSYYHLIRMLGTALVFSVVVTLLIRIGIKSGKIFRNLFKKLVEVLD